MLPLNVSSRREIGFEERFDVFASPGIELGACKSVRKNRAIDESGAYDGTTELAILLAAGGIFRNYEIVHLKTKPDVSIRVRIIDGYEALAPSGGQRRRRKVDT